MRLRFYTCFAFVVVLLAVLIHQDAGSVLSDDGITTSGQANNFERGKKIEKVSAQDLHTAYREIQQDYHAKAFGPGKKWKILKDHDGVEVAMMHHPADPTCPYVRMTAMMPTSVQDCWDFLRLARWDESMPKMDPFYEGVWVQNEFRHKGVSMTLARKRTKRILAFGKRDFVFVSVADNPLPDGTWVSGTVSVVTDQMPRYQGYTRAFQDSVAFYKPLAPNQTRLTIVCRIDLNDSGEGGDGGAIPMWIYVKTIGTTALHSVLNMRKHLQLDLAAKEEQRKQQQQQQQAEQLSKKQGRFRWLGRKRD